MSTMTILAVIAIAAALVVAWHLDRRSWSKRSNEELERMVAGTNPLGWKNGLVELQRRQIDGRELIPVLLPHLLDDSKW
jgi:hypothetical protein